MDPAAWWPEASVDCTVGQMRAVEFATANPGDWAVHCHKSHHTMNAMGHQVRTYIGVNMKTTAKAIAKVSPGYMPMGATSPTNGRDLRPPEPATSGHHTLWIGRPERPRSHAL
jgi:hypothetical protein